MADQNLSNALEDDEPLFDAADVAVYLDDKLVKYFNGNDLVGITWLTDNVTLEIDAQGAGTAVKNHDDRATITMHLNRASDTWQEIMGYGASTGYHKINIVTPYEHVYSGKSLLTKKPDINIGGGAQTVDCAFSCVKATLEGNKAA